MQMLRLLRIVRLIRLVKMIGPLYSLALGIAEAMQGMFWVLIFLFMMLYTTAIFTTRMIGPGSDLLFEGEAAQDSDIVENREMFTTVGSSMFVLFESMSCWSLMQFVPIFRLYPVIRLLAVFFYIFANWCLLAVMTGVVSEKMLATREKMRQEETGTGNLEIAGEALAQLGSALAELFSKADSDGSGSISREAWLQLVLF
ncbi:unnamed protein product [Polarella glacialis]|uniref:Ion transport domain-containing protein n=1 Tax=Polarella glacialis TaxID=89957 RepID=A0A813JF01_POLGL|nr:unnamed protein product [Polarella glacialis]